MRINRIKHKLPDSKHIPLVALKLEDKMNIQNLQTFNIEKKMLKQSIITNLFTDKLWLPHY